MARTVTPDEVRLALILRREIALVDLREEDPYARGHPLWAVQLSLSRLELDAPWRLPRKAAPIVLYDDGEGLTQRGASRLADLGYTNVAVMEGGLAGWRAAGFEVFIDVNSASKAFGELVEARRHTPSVPAPEALKLIESEPNLVVLDARRFEEFNTMSIPRGVSTPGAELVLRARAMAPDPETAIVVNCAGRTRSIIGAQSLINAGVPNKVMALRNGTIGWSLAGQALEHGKTARFSAVDAAVEADARQRARAVSYRAGVKHISLDGLAVLTEDSGRTLYRYDVRTPEEFEAGHIAGFRSAPGGQLVQETDVFCAVRGARVVLADDKGARADMTASWLAQMGWEVYVLDGGFDGPLRTEQSSTLTPRSEDEAISVDALEATLDGVTVIDFSPNPAFRRAHIPGAWFAIRAQIAEALQVLPDRPLVVTAHDEALSALAAQDVAALTGHRPKVLAGGTAAWIAAGKRVETGLDRAANAPTDVYRRPYEGSDNPREAMQAYLDWEYGLVAQLERDGTHGFYVI